MASGNWEQNINFRPQYGNNPNVWSPRRSGDINRPNRDREQICFPNNNNVNQHALQDFTTYQTKAKDDETTGYVVSLQLKPAKMGIIANNGRWKQTFQGLGAFNHYFGLCAPTNGLGYTLSDIWDGYFHITLAKFFTRLTPERLEGVFSKFNPSLEVLPNIDGTVFRATSITSCPGTNRARDRQNIDFVLLPVDSSSETKAFYENIQPLLGKIKEQVESTYWNVTPHKYFHVTVRKYSNIDFELKKIKIQEFPLEFRCSHLEVRQPREQAIYRFKRAKNNTDQWWTGVTEIDGKCSGCKTPIMSDVWEGFCLACGRYESIIPIWSTDGKNVFHLRQIQQQELMGNYNNTLSELVQHVKLNEL